MTNNGNSVVTIGGATAEKVLNVPHGSGGKDSKTTHSPSPRLAGGGAINHACRLLAAGTPAFPITPACPDSAGKDILETLNQAAAKGGFLGFSEENIFLDSPDLSTPFTTIINRGSSREIHTEFSEDLIAAFENSLVQHLDELTGKKVPAVMIGHLQADRRETPGRGGRLTERIIHTFRNTKTMLFANFGAAQYMQGFDKWGTSLGDLTCFQLHINEMRHFLHVRGNHWPNLVEILKWFRTRCNVIITLERMGAIGQSKGSDNLVLTWPYEINPMDTTGAGDAFGAGVVSFAIECPLVDDEALKHAMERGALFSAFACTTLGGAHDCPSMDELKKFESAGFARLETDIMTVSDAEKVLWLLDRAFVLPKMADGER